MVAPPARLTVSVPLETVRRVVARLPSTSVTEIPPIGRAVVLVHRLGARHRIHRPVVDRADVIATASESVAPLASVETTVSVSEPLKSALPWYERLAKAGIDLGLRARQRQGRAAVGAGADRRPTARLDVQAAVVTLSCGRREVAVDVVDREAADRERGVFVDALRARHRVSPGRRSPSSP
jgi:hypothetical protein